MFWHSCLPIHRWLVWQHLVFTVGRDLSISLFLTFLGEEEKYEWSSSAIPTEQFIQTPFQISYYVWMGNGQQTETCRINTYIVQNSNTSIYKEWHNRIMEHLMLEGTQLIYYTRSIHIPILTKHYYIREPKNNNRNQLLTLRYR